MDHKFTEQIKQWLETPESERDYSIGALYLLKLSGNQIMYRNIIAHIDSRHESAFISTSPEIFANLHAQVNDLITNHSVPLHDLFRERIAAD